MNETIVSEVMSRATVAGIMKPSDATRMLPLQNLVDRLGRTAKFNPEFANYSNKVQKENKIMRAELANWEKERKKYAKE